jgi:phosphoribosylamine--glycine ligase
MKCILTPMKVLLVGDGGREHALAWKLKQSLKVTQIYIAPGNPGTATVGINVNVSNTKEILEWLSAHEVDLVVIGPDNYLAEGLTDLLQAKGIPVFGPTKAAAEIEWSKAYAKQFMLEEGIPTARSRVFTTADVAREYIRTQTFPMVIKADGLAAGKGVTIAETLEEADAAITSMLEEKMFGVSGSKVIIEEYLEGFEISVHAFCDGDTALLFPVSKDHKRIGEGDTGPNTGGMGTIAPVGLIPEEQLELIKQRIVLPTLAGLKKRGRPFSGVLFPGIMLTASGPQVIEFNARFGDPETQSYMRLLESDLFNILYACATNSLAGIEVAWSSKFACCIVAASEGYPGNIEKDLPIVLPPTLDDIVIFHAGTKLKNDHLVTNGGRVLGVSAIGDSLQEALLTAYKGMEQVGFSGKQYRRDIGAAVL